MRREFRFGGILLGLVVFASSPVIAASVTGSEISPPEVTFGIDGVHHKLNLDWGLRGPDGEDLPAGVARAILMGRTPFEAGTKFVGRSDQANEILADLFGPDSVSLFGDLVIDPDPVIAAGVGFSSLFPGATYSFNIVSPLLPTIAVAATSNLTWFGTAIDSGANDGTSIALAGGFTGLVTATIEGVAVQSAGAGQTVGTPGGFLAGGGTTSILVPPTAGDGASPMTSFDLRLDFTAGPDTAGDGVSFTLRHELIPVPLPAAAWMGLSFLAVVGVVNVVRSRMYRAA